MGFNLFGSSKGNSTNNYDQRQDNSVHVTKTNADRLSGNAMKAGGNITVTDGGAFDLANDVTSHAIDAVEGTAENAFGLVAHTTDSAFELSNSVVNGMKESNERTASQLTQSFADTLGTVERLAASEDATTAKSMEKIGLLLVGGLVLTFMFVARK